MAAIAMAESGGNRWATDYDSNGTVDRGLWQINSAWGDRWSNFGALGNAEGAVHVARVQGLSAWVTYNTGAFHGYCGQ